MHKGVLHRIIYFNYRYNGKLSHDKWYNVYSVFTCKLFSKYEIIKYLELVGVMSYPALSDDKCIYKAPRKCLHPLKAACITSVYSTNSTTCSSHQWRYQQSPFAEGHVVMQRAGEWEWTKDFLTSLPAEPSPPHMRFFVFCEFLFIYIY